MTYLVPKLKKSLEESIKDSLRLHVLNTCACIVIDGMEEEDEIPTEAVMQVMQREQPLYEEAVELLNKLITQGKICEVSGFEY